MLLLFVGLTLITSSCSPLDLAKTVLGGGPNIAATAQVGKTNTQGVNVTSEAPSVTVRPKARVDNIDQRTTNTTNVDWWIIALLIIGWLAPSPGEIARGVTNLIKGKN